MGYKILISTNNSAFDLIAHTAASEYPFEVREDALKVTILEKTTKKVKCYVFPLKNIYVASAVEE